MRPGVHNWEISDLPLLIPVGGMTGGIALCGLGASTMVWTGAAVFMVGIILSIWRKWPRVVFFFSGGLLGIAAWMVALPSRVETGTIDKFRGKLVSVYDYGVSQRVVVDMGGNRRIGVTVHDFPHKLEVGDSVEVRGLLLPAVAPVSVPYEADGSSFARNEMLSARCVVSEDDFRLIADASGMRKILNRLRDTVSEGIRHSGLRQETAAFLCAVLLGESDIEPEVRESFARSGLSHMLALSGTHVSTIAFMLAFILMPVEMAGGRKMRLVVTLVFLWGYAVLTGMSPSVVRAVTMASFLIVGKLSGRYPNPMNSLLGAAMLILLFRPSALFLAGFQLSFLAVAGILLAMPPVMAVLNDTRWGSKWGTRTLANVVLLPVVAVVATAPLSAWHFHYFPVWFLVANLPAAILLPVALCGGCLVAVAGVVGWHVPLLVRGMDWIYNVMELVAKVSGSLPGNMETADFYFPGWILVLIYGGMFLIWYGWRGGRKVYLINGGVMVVASVVVALAVRPVVPPNEWYVWGVNRGTALVWREGKDVVIFTDAASKYHPEIKEQAQVRLAGFLGRRRAELRDVVPVSILPERVGEHSFLWKDRDCRILFLMDKSDVGCLAQELEGGGYVIVSAGFKGDICDVASSYPRCCLVLSPSIPPVRRRKYARLLKESGRSYLLNLPPEASRYSPSTK